MPTYVSGFTIVLSAIITVSSSLTVVSEWSPLSLETRRWFDFFSFDPLLLSLYGVCKVDYL
jgi:hypothetical protein